jgi:hypothetical protein
LAIGTGIDTILAAGADIRVNHHDTICPLMGCLGRTYIHTRGPFTVITVLRNIEET